MQAGGSSNARSGCVSVADAVDPVDGLTSAQAACLSLPQLGSALTGDGSDRPLQRGVS